jgi:hypothetical protein
VNTDHTARRDATSRRGLGGELAGVWPLGLTLARRYPAHGDHHRHPHRAKPKQARP